MPQIFKFGPYTIFFWSNEGEPLEPIHIHVSYKIATPNSTKIWITKSGKCLIDNNASKISKHQLNKIIRNIESNIDIIKEEWLKHFDCITYYC